MRENKKDLRIALVVPEDRDLWNFRRPLIEALVSAGVQVLAITPPGPYTERLKALGCMVIPWSLDRRSMKPWKEVRSFITLYHIYRRWRPTIAHHFTIKPNLYGVMAARLAGVPIALATVTGLGYLWTETRWTIRLFSLPLKWAYQSILRLADRVLVFNQEDLKTLGDSINSILWPGEGIDVEEWSPDSISPDKLKRLHKELGIPDGSLVVLMVSRMLRHKGVYEFAQAARIVREHYPQVWFLLVGPVDQGNPACISKEELKALESQSGLQWLGMREDIKELMAMADVLVLPSYYREGVPQVLLEGAAMGKALVASDISGCREVVQHGQNGFLVPPKDAKALAEALEKLVAEPELRIRFGQSSRALAVERFSSQKLVAKMLRLYEELLSSHSIPVPSAFYEDCPEKD